MVNRIPFNEIEIADNWRLADLATPQDADEALLHVTRDIASIDSQLEEFESETAHGAEVSEADADWLRSAKAARKIKQTLLQLVQNRRVEIIAGRKRDDANSENRKLLALLKQRAPAVFAAAVSDLEAT